jgi:hypothetical protein
MVFTTIMPLQSLLRNSGGGRCCGHNCSVIIHFYCHRMTLQSKELNFEFANKKRTVLFEFVDIIKYIYI